MNVKESTGQFGQSVAGARGDKALQQRQERVLMKNA